MISAKATITTRWNGVQKPIDVRRVIEFDVDSGIDTDSDEWSLSLGDHNNELVDVLKRDNEVRVSLFIATPSTLKVLSTGFTDEIGFDIDNRLVFQGRDMSAPAVDSQAPPGKWKNVRVKSLIEKEARSLGIGSRINITDMGEIPRLWRDGSESYWEFWYRMVRKKKKYLWYDPTGTLYGDDLNYNAKPIYKFGEPMQNGQKGWIPVETAMWKKSTTSRIGEITVYGHNGQSRFQSTAKDKSIQHWVKKPTKIVTDSSLNNFREANDEALDQIHDSIVGAVEWRFIIADPGFLIETNQMAVVNLPSIGLNGNFFVVGARYVLGESEGFYQEIRLREKNFALPKAVPTDPQLDSDEGTIIQQIPDEGASSSVAKNLDISFIECFIKAANAKYGPWGFTLFLAVLLGIGDQETGFRNVREGGETGWYNPPSVLTDPAGLKRFQQLFANSAGNSLTPSYGGTRREAGVGVMQLTDRNLKEAADKLKDPQLIDEYIGGRWSPCDNIMEAAIYLRSILAPWEKRADPEDIWNGVGAYNGGPTWKTKPRAVAYMNSVRHKVLDPGGYLDQVKAAFSPGLTVPATGSLIYPLGEKHDGYPNFPMGGISAHYGKPPENWQSDNAVDLGVPVGTQVYAMDAGRIIGQLGIGANSQFGSFSKIQGQQFNSDAPDVDSGMKGLRLTLECSGNSFYYAHLSRLVVRPGQSVSKGQLLGYSGWANAAHLHIACQYPLDQSSLPPGNMQQLIQQATFRWLDQPMLGD